MPLHKDSALKNICRFFRNFAAMIRETSDLTALPAHFALDDDLSRAYDLMESTSQSLFITGRAGTGKSSLLKYFRLKTKKKVVVLAPTGLAALQVGGSTIHSFFGFPLRTLMRNDPDIKIWGKGHPRFKVVQKMDVLIIDEVSMVRSDVFDAIDESLRLNTGLDVPFGGKQVILIGDVFQLPPVDKGSVIENVETDRDTGHYFFNAQSFREMLPKVVELKKVYRQEDPDFIALLNRIRNGSVTEGDLKDLNRQRTESESASFTITLSSVNAIADNVNLKNLMMLKSPSFEYKAVLEGIFPEKNYPAPVNLRLKEGSQVMMVKNDLQGRWVNGSIGIVDCIDENEIKVRFPDRSVHLVEKATWEHKNYSWDKSSRSISSVIQGTFRQYPLRLAWAMTIHKSQGLTFDRIIVDIGKGAFAHGQLYVALSRCRSLEGIQLRSPITLKDVIIDEHVESFVQRFRIG